MRIDFERTHRITLAVGNKLTRAYRKLYGRTKGYLVPVGYSRSIFDDILAQPGCMGIRFYGGADAKGRATLVLAGFDRDGNDIVGCDNENMGRFAKRMSSAAAQNARGPSPAVIGDVPWRCPPLCSKPNPLNT